MKKRTDLGLSRRTESSIQEKILDFEKKNFKKFDWLFNEMEIVDSNILENKNKTFGNFPVYFCNISQLIFFLSLQVIKHI